jgi:hypothetical protein
MSLESAVKEEIHAISGLLDRVFPLTAPELFPPPYAVYVSSQGVNERTLSEVLSSKEVEFEISVISSDYSELKTLTSGVIQRLQSFQSRAIGTTTPTFIQEIVLEEPDEQWDRQLNLVRCVIGFTLYL